MITQRQKDTLDFIVAFQRERGGVSPSVREIAQGLRCNSKSTHTAHRMLVALERLGFIRRLPGRARAIEVLRAVPIVKMREAWFRFDEEVKELVPYKGRQ